jgi:serine/threonine-protein kinase
MARVYRVRKGKRGPDLAAKVLRAQFESQEEIRHRFLREAHILEDLDHPCVVKVLDVGPPTTPAWFVMEWISGRSLAEALRERKPIGDERALQIMGDVLAGLDHAHQRGIVHRDLKPENVLLTQDGRARLSDFGIAKMLEGTQLTATGTRLGTPHYMAPEQIRGRRSVGVGADIYSAGVLFYELLTGKRPFDGDDPVAIGYCHAYESPPPLKRRGKPVPAPLVALVEKALEKKVSSRWRSARTMRTALKKAATGLSVELPAVPPPNKKSRKHSRKKSPKNKHPPSRRRPTSSSPGFFAPVLPGRRHPLPKGLSLRAMIACLITLVTSSVAVNLIPSLRPGSDARSPAQAQRGQKLFLKGLSASSRGNWLQADLYWKAAARADPSLLTTVRDHAAQAFRNALDQGRQDPSRIYLKLVRWADPGWVPGLDYERRYRRRWPR